MSDTPKTDDAFDALGRKACGTRYVQTVMQNLERENDKLTRALLEITFAGHVGYARKRAKQALDAKSL